MSALQNIVAIVTALLLIIPVISGLEESPAKVERKLSASVNPGCPENVCFLNESSHVTLIHVRAESDVDIIHYVWDFIGKPTVLVALTGKETKLRINWDDFIVGKPNSVNFTELPKYTFMTVINRIFQFDDPHDRGAMHDDSPMHEYNPHSFKWNRTLFWVNERDVILALNAGNDFLFKLNAYSSRDHSMEFPHLLHTSNSTQVDIVFSNVSTQFARPRFAIELMFVVSEQATVGEHFEVTRRKNLDDEHTPGIFELVDILSPGAFKFSTGGFFEYRPVSYTSPERDISTATETHQSEIKTIDFPSRLLNDTLPYAMFGELLDTRLVQGVNISFGFTGDGYYTKTNYTTMTFQLGYGYPPVEKLSPFVIIVAGLGIGIPLLMVIVGGVFVCIKKFRSSHGSRL